jgi:hypothetical protein
MTQLFRVADDIVDVDATRVLTLAKTGDRLSIYRPATGLTEPIALPAGVTVYPKTPRLTPTGAIFIGSPGPRVYVLRNGTLLDFGVAHRAWLVVNGSYAIWMQDGENLYRLDTSAGLPSLVTSQGLPSTNDATDAAVGPDGTVVFRASTASTGDAVIRDRNGVQTQLIDSTMNGPLGVLTDGTNVIYLDAFNGEAIGFIADSQPPVLLSQRTTSGALGTGPNYYQVDGGWTAFTSVVDPSRDLIQVFSRDLMGQIVQRTDLAGPSSFIEELAANGELMTLTDRAFYGKRYFSRPGQFPIEVSTWNGRSYFIEGMWYIVLGGTLLAVDTAIP